MNTTKSLFAPAALSSPGKVKQRFSISPNWYVSPPQKKHELFIESVREEEEEKGKHSV